MWDHHLKLKLLTINACMIIKLRLFTLTKMCYIFVCSFLNTALVLWLYALLMNRNSYINKVVNMKKMCNYSFCDINTSHEIWWIYLVEMLKF